MSARPRVGLVGTSAWAAQVHGASAAEHPDVDLVGVYGRDQQKAAHVAATLGTDYVPDFQALLDRVDILTFAVPPPVQAAMVLDATGRGIRMLLEKPTGLDIRQARKVAEATSEIRTSLMLTRRWEPRTVAWLAALAAQDGWASGSACFINALTPDVLASSPWREEHGALWDVGPHAVSVLEAVLGEVLRVRAAAGADGLVQLLLTHSSGAVSTTALSLRATSAAAHTDVGFWGAAGHSPPLPALTLPDVKAAHQAAMSALIGDAPVAGPDAAYGLHVTEVLAEAAAALAHEYAAN